jgi:hypothetical protein
VDEIALYTTRELIDELMRRKTFLGVVVHAEDELRTAEWRGDQTFKVRFNTNLDAARVGRLLDVVAEHLELRQDDLSNE